MDALNLIISLSNNGLIIHLIAIKFFIPITYFNQINWFDLILNFIGQKIPNFV